MATTTKNTDQVVDKETTTTMKDDAKTLNKDAEIESLKAQNRDLNAKLELIMTMLKQQNTASASVPVTSKREEEITIVHMLQCYDGMTTHIALTNRDIDMRVIGETRVLTLPEAEEVASKYRRFFERGVITFAPEHAAFAKKFDLVKYINKGDITPEFLDKIGDMSLSDLEVTFTSLAQAQKALVIETFKRKIDEHDPRFDDLSKMQLLDRLTTGYNEVHGAMEGDLLDFQSRKR